MTQAHLRTRLKSLFFPPYLGVMLGILPLTFVREWEEKSRSQQVTGNYTLTLDKHKIKALISPKNELEYSFSLTGK